MIESANIGLYRWRGVLAFVVVAALLGIMLVQNERARSGGYEIILETQPIDPRDIFFGHYAILSYNLLRAEPDRIYAAMEPALIEASQARFDSAAEEQSEPVEVYVRLESDGLYHRISGITADNDAARSGDAPFLTAELRLVVPYGCVRDEGARCWNPVITIDLPSRYYADKDTALALQSRQGDSARQAQARREYEECEAARAISGADVPQRCADMTEPPETPPDFGVILSTSTAGEAVIKGVYHDGRKFYDTLTGLRITKTDLE